MHILRPAVFDDLPSICLLGQEVNRLHHSAWPGVFAAPSDPSRDKAHWRDGIDALDRATFVTETAGAVQAFMTIEVIDEQHSMAQPMRFARVGSICVAPAHRGQGIGRSLMAAAEDWALQQGAAEVRLVVWKFNESAVRLYEEIGYQVRSLSMSKPITPLVA